jgi:hypothetical protein
MRKINSFLGIVFIIIFSFQAFSQNKQAIVPILTADSLSSGNFKDVLTSFFSLTINDLTGPSKEVKFTSNIFAIMLKSNSNLLVDTNYLKYTAYRNFNIDLDVKDSNDRFNNLSVGLKYAIVNKRDYTVAKTFVPLFLHKASKLIQFGDTIKAKIGAINDIPTKVKLQEQANKFCQDTSLIPFSKLDIQLQAIVKESYSKVYNVDFTKLKEYNNYSFRKAANAIYDSIKNSFQNKVLWTLGANFSKYTDPHQLSNLTFTTEFLKGFINPDAATNLELAIDGSYNLSDDSTKTASNLNRGVITGSLGLNWVVKGWGHNQSFLELKIAASENAVVSGMYKGESQNVFTMDGTLRIRVSDSFWVPIQIKYDPKSGNVFGFLNITSNFNWLSHK